MIPMGKSKNKRLDFDVHFVIQSEIKQLKAGTLTVKDSFLRLKNLVNILKLSLK